MFNVCFKKLGGIDKGEIRLNKLTILCGENNTGKTYAAYAIYGMLKEISAFSSKIITNKLAHLKNVDVINLDLETIINNDFDAIINEIGDLYTNKLNRVFNIEKDKLKHSSVGIKVNKDKIKSNILRTHFQKETRKSDNNLLLSMEKKVGDFNLLITTYDDKDEFPVNGLIDLASKHLTEVIFDTYTNDAFLLPAERTGLNLFFKELNVKRNELLHNISTLDEKKKVNLFKLLNQNIVKYPLPISDYLNFLNEMEIYNNMMCEYEGIANKIKETVIKGKYTVEDQNIYFIPLDVQNEKLDLHATSSTVKTFFGLTYYFEHRAEKGDFLIIDEPELNLHPDNQRKIARALAQISNSGINVIISTHSDYIIKEINNLIMLSENFEGHDALMQKYGYRNEELIKPENVSVYLFKNRSIIPMEIIEEGIIAETFDQVINSLNKVSDDIYFTKMEALNSEQ